jgi:hypothetical protein
MLRKVITGGQTGADQAGWRAARRAGLDAGGLMPRGFLTEDGPRPDIAREFSAAEHDSDDPAGRTVANVEAAGATVIFAAPEPGPGTRLTLDTCRRLGRPHRLVTWRPGGPDATPEDIAGWVLGLSVGVLNVAGDRESTAPGIGARVEAFLDDVFGQVGARQRS